MEVSHTRPNIPRLNWALHRIKAKPVTTPIALLTSDSDDMTKLCGNQVRIIPL
ncbi:hypothetical protein EES46_03760 [Streptomyces sp. ADI98-10]|nr:hypothetical protein EES46_03760 [Streptomyces sp. ADI98-10]